MSRKWLILLPILLVGVALDLATKQLILEYVTLESQIPVIKGFFNVVHFHNRGSAVFGLFASWPLASVRVLFVGTSSLVLVVVAYFWWRLPPGQQLAALGYSLIMAGALGNLVDRVRFGEVVDFLDFYWDRYHFPAFNLADIMICLGAGLLVLVILRETKGVNVSIPV
ncbi:MAG: signal peptidase II [Syntrophales bacterium]|nr:signal peptidase II [Syntrophales bacterium]